jgi:hypothetical protein
VFLFMWCMLMMNNVFYVLYNANLFMASFFMKLFLELAAI